jgi:hypothetical protein
MFLVSTVASFLLVHCAFITLFDIPLVYRFYVFSFCWLPFVFLADQMHTKTFMFLGLHTRELY